MRYPLYNWQKEDILNTLTAQECVWAIELLQKRLERLTTPPPTDPVNTPIDDLELSIRAYNALRSVKINTIKDILNYGMDKVYYLKGAGPKTIQEIRQAVESKLKGATPPKVHS